MTPIERQLLLDYVRELDRDGQHEAAEVLFSEVIADFRAYDTNILQSLALR